MQPDHETISKLLAAQDEQFRVLCLELLAAGARPHMLRRMVSVWCEMDQAAAEGGTPRIGSPVYDGYGSADNYNQMAMGSAPPLGVRRLHVPQLVNDQAAQLNATFQKVGAQVDEYVTLLQTIEAASEQPQSSIVSPDDLDEWDGTEAGG